jgi:hypothetical protein
LVLYNNASAHDPTWVELKAFLLSDKTDEILYVDGEFVCGDFAETLHNNAEASGIRGAFVIIWWVGSDASGFGHAINAFNTSDMGMKYIDDIGWKVASPCGADSEVILTGGEKYIPINIFPCSWGKTYGDPTVECFSVQW